MKISYRKDRKLGRREKPQTSATSTKQTFITLLYIISPGPGLRAQLIGTVDWRCANLDELPVPVLIQRKAAVPAQLLEPAGVGIWAAERRRGGCALGHGELFWPRQAHEQSRQTVSPAFLLCRLQFPSSSPASFDPRPTRLLLRACSFRMGISFRLGRQIELSGPVVHRIRSHRFVILSPIVSSFCVDVSWAIREFLDLVMASCCQTKFQTSSKGIALVSGSCIRTDLKWLVE